MSSNVLSRSDHSVKRNLCVQVALVTPVGLLTTHDPWDITKGYTK